MDTHTYYYTQASGAGADLVRQAAAFQALGAEEQAIITDRADCRDGYRALKDHRLRRGDTLVVRSLACLGRQAGSLRQELQYLKAHGIRLRVMDLPTTMADLPAEQHWALDMMRDLLLDLLDAAAAQDRAPSDDDKPDRRPTSKSGKKLGRPAITFPDNWDTVYAAWQAGTITAKAAMEQTGTKRTSFYKLVGMMGKESPE